jgi:hypothetical protein
MATRKKRKGQREDTRPLTFASWPKKDGPEEEDPEEGLERPPKRRFSVDGWFLSPGTVVCNRHTFARFPASAIASQWARIYDSYVPGA